MTGERPPDPGALHRRARSAAEAAAAGGLLVDPRAANVVVDGTPLDPDEVAVDDGGYAGAEATTAAGLSAAIAAVDDAPDGAAALHYPGATPSAEGPWLVVTPHAGRLATVARGRADLRVVVDAAGDLDGTIDRLEAAAAPTHEHYPVADDDLGVFVRGVTTFDRTAVAPRDAGPGTHVVDYDVTVTPATTADAVEDRFAGVDGVAAVEYAPAVAVERAAPSARLRRAVEAAADAVVGDAAYEWLAGPGVFSDLPGTDKVALGAADPGADRVDAADRGTTRALLARTIETLAEETLAGDP